MIGSFMCPFVVLPFLHELPNEVQGWYIDRSMFYNFWYFNNNYVFLHNVLYFHTYHVIYTYIILVCIN